MMTRPSTNQNNQRLTVMVVDDNAIFLEFVENLLERLGFATLSAPDGQQCLDTMAKATVDLVLTDIFMPEMDGIELMRHISERHTQVPVVGMTGDFGRVKRPYLRAMEALGAKAVLAKPFTSDELISVLGQITDEKPAPS